MKKILFLLTVFFGYNTFSQVTLRVTSIPTNTPVNATIYFAGSTNNWNPNDTNSILALDGFGNRQIVIPEGQGVVEYKFTRGSWASVEGNANGTFLPNRTFTFTGSPQVVDLTILSWEDLGGSSSNSTAASNVQILNTAFFMPELNRNRKIWLYLPPDYTTSTKTYPVLYMQDGQNLFDNTTSFSGEWQVDETLNTLFSQGDYGAIVVGIDNGGSERLNEYSPWNNPQYGGGQGQQYMVFLANTLKPYIDSNYRTKPQPEMNALIGSSMGGLIATYGACEFQNQFKKVGSMSPSYWFSLANLNTYIQNTSNLNGHRMYFVAGTNESSSMVSNINTVKGNLQNSGLMTSNTFTKFDADGTHTESYWRREFGALYQWLFADENLMTETYKKNIPTINQLNNGQLFLKGFDEEISFTLYSIYGQEMKKITLKNGLNNPLDLSGSGIFILKNNNTFYKVFNK